MGAVSLIGRNGQPLVGEDLGNAMKKATTQAKRRVTLSICGLAFLDETETSQVPGAIVYQSEDQVGFNPNPQGPAQIAQDNTLPPSAVTILKWIDEGRMSNDELALLKKQTSFPGRGKAQEEDWDRLFNAANDLIEAREEILDSDVEPLA
jgi:hypothetical protein